MKPHFPTTVHERAAQAVVDFAVELPVRAVLPVNSRARGTATLESDLDLAPLIDPELPLRERESYSMRLGGGGMRATRYFASLRGQSSGLCGAAP